MDYIFDIDGTLADCAHRLHYVKHKPKNYGAFYKAAAQDTPIHVMCHLAHTLAASRGARLVFCTGRPESLREVTAAWISANVGGSTKALYMRAELDHRRDDIVKRELYDRILADGYVPCMVFDDRPRVCDMWKTLGLLVARVGDVEHF